MAVFQDSPTEPNTPIATESEDRFAAKSSRKCIVVAAAAILDGKKLMAAQRGYGKWEGWWEFPGGKLEPGEKADDALRRELREEMDTEIEVDQFYRTIVYDYEEFNMTMHLFLCHLKSNDFTLKEHKSMRWLRQDELEEVKWLPADVELISEWVSNGLPQPE